MAEGAGDKQVIGSGKHMLYALNVKNDGFEFASSISSALEKAELDICALDETINSLKRKEKEIAE